MFLSHVQSRWVLAAVTATLISLFAVDLSSLRQLNRSVLSTKNLRTSHRQLNFHGSLCPEFLACTTHLGGAGYRMQSQKLMGLGCFTSCVPVHHVRLYTKIGKRQCGTCEDYSLPFNFSTTNLVNRTLLARLSSDALEGRDNARPGSVLAQQLLIEDLQSMGAQGLVSDTDYFQEFVVNDTGTETLKSGKNILAVLRGNELADEYIFLSAHYDHLSNCTVVSTANSSICNGAMDDASGVAIVLSIGRSLSGLRLRRSVVLALWDREEDGLIGSRYFAETDPIVPLDKIVTFLNFDIQGSNLSPSAKKLSFAIGSETGGGILQEIVARAAEETDAIDMRRFSYSIGGDTSDHVWFIRAGVPSVFYSDTINACYHSTGDEYSMVDLAKLDEEAANGVRVTYELAQTTVPPTFRKLPLIPVNYQDTLILRDMADAAINDIALFPAEQEGTVRTLQRRARHMVKLGPALFLLSLIHFQGVATGLYDSFSTLECSGFF